MPSTMSGWVDITQVSLNIGYSPKILWNTSWQTLEQSYSTLRPQETVQVAGKEILCQQFQAHNHHKSPVKTAVSHLRESPKIQKNNSKNLHTPNSPKVSNNFPKLSKDSISHPIFPPISPKARRPWSCTSNAGSPSSLSTTRSTNFQPGILDLGTTAGGEFGDVLNDMIYTCVLYIYTHIYIYT